ncbi:MAG: substrate-binding domain-containing protein [Pseudomonadota bacterium]
MPQKRNFVVGSALGLLMATAMAEGTGDAAADATTVRLLASGAFSDASRDLVASYRETLGLRVEGTFGSSLKAAPTSVPRRLEQGEAADVVLAATDTINDLIAKGLVLADSRVDILQSALGAVVPAGAPVPPIQTVAEVATALLQASSVAYSASLSGTYYETEMLKKLGIEAQVLPKSKRTAPGERVATVVARGDASLGIQQVSELLTAPGVTFVGKLPDSIQRYTVFSAGIPTLARNPAGARRLIEFLSSAPSAHDAFRKNGLEPVH